MLVLHLSAVEMARKICAGEISSLDLVQAHIDRIREINPAVNAVVELMADEAIDAAKRADEELKSGPVARGRCMAFPFSVKDSIDVAGVKTTAGTLGRKNASAAEADATLVRRLRDTGGIPIAKTNLPDLLFCLRKRQLDLWTNE